MLNELLTVTAENALKGYPREVSIGEAALYALLGFLVVFAGIALLIFVVWAIGRVMAYVKGERKPAVKLQDLSQKAEQLKQEPSVTMQAEEVTEETVAVIMAALMAYYESNYPKCEFKVRRIKKI